MNIVFVIGVMVSVACASILKEKDFLNTELFRSEKKGECCVEEQGDCTANREGCCQAEDGPVYCWCYPYPTRNGSTTDKCFCEHSGDMFRGEQNPAHQTRLQAHLAALNDEA